MGLDLRWPIGLMFTLLGAMLSITGLVTASDTEMYKRSLGLNIDLWWGLALLAFGVLMLILAKKGAKRIDQTGNEKSGSDNIKPQ